MFFSYLTIDSYGPVDPLNLYYPHETIFPRVKLIPLFHANVSGDKMIGSEINWVLF